MATKTPVKKTECIQVTLDILGDKWTALLVRELTDGCRRFGDLEMALEGISPRTLSQRLDKLVKEGIVDTKQYCEHPPRVTYALTKKGLELQAILAKMSDWGARYAG
jgi:DNA-binding HxlR family transcriptional regulator